MRGVAALWPRQATRPRRVDALSGAAKLRCRPRQGSGGTTTGRRGLPRAEEELGPALLADVAQPLEEDLGYGDPVHAPVGVAGGLRISRHEDREIRGDRWRVVQRVDDRPEIGFEAAVLAEEGRIDGQEEVADVVMVLDAAQRRERGAGEDARQDCTATARP